MHFQLKKALLLLLLCLAIGSPGLLAAQVFEDPASTNSHFSLDIPPGGTFIFPSPTTLNIGEIDRSILAAFNGAVLNDVVILGPDFNTGGGIVFGGLENSAPLWTITHSSAQDTQALQLLPRIDLQLDPATPVFYEDASSVQVLDLNGDGQNDIAYMGSSEDFTNPVKNRGTGTVFGVQGNTSAPFFVDVPTVLGSQLDGTVPSSNDIDGSQPALTANNFISANALIDLGFYDVETGGTLPDLISILENDGSLGPLPKLSPPIDSPVAPPDDNGMSVVSGDFDGDGEIEMAISFASVGPDYLAVYPGNGAGGFSSIPTVEVTLTVQQDRIHGLVFGDFDGSSHLDFALAASEGDLFGAPSELYLILCNDATPPPACSLQSIPLNTYAFNLAAADFNNDGLDDLAITRDTCVDPQCADFTGEVGVYLNQDGSFTGTPDQTLTLLQSDRVSLVQVVAGDVDACGGPDLAYIGDRQPLPQGSAELFLASVAFNANEAPVADAGSAVQTSNGVQVGGDPTCLDPTGDLLSIEWVILSGQGTISDPSAANPVVTNADGDVTLQVTCTDACGASDADTVSFTAQGGLLEGSGIGCGLGTIANSAVNFSNVFIAGITLGSLALLRRIKSK